MRKMIISILLLNLFFTGCSEKKREEKEPVKAKIIQKDDAQKENNISNAHISVKILKPFKPTLETNISQEEVITESLEELETSAFKTIQPRIIEAMQKIPECLENAQSKDEAFACSKTLRALNKELAMGMGDLSDEPSEGYGEDFTWDEETKVEMIREIEAGTRAMQEMQTCIEASKTPEELAKCLEP